MYLRGGSSETDTMPARPQLLGTYLKNHFLGLRSRLPMKQDSRIPSASLFGLQGIINLVVHPGSIEVASRDRVKTDKRDALKIATQLSAGRLSGIFVPSQEREEKRSVTRLRTNILKLRHQVGQQFKALLFTQGLIELEDDTRLCSRWLSGKLKEVDKGGYSNDFCYSVHQYAEEWIQLTERMKKIELMLDKQASEERGLQIIYESVPGIGPIHARQLANELGNMVQFKNEKQLFSFTGLTPSEHSSGEHTRQGHITRQGNSVLRRIFIEAAWIAITRDPSLREIFNRLSTSRGKKASDYRCGPTIGGSYTRLCFDRIII